MAEEEEEDEEKELRGEEFENQHVHDVYEQIAPHFSSTRYKPWPLVQHFLHSIPPSSIVLDLGTGNGKYLPLLPYPSTTSLILASDRSPSLITLTSHTYCRSTPHEALIADILSPPHPHGRFDAAISIAVIHHLSTRERRVAAVRAMLECLRVGGRGLIEVWALEQRESRRGWGEGDEQDVMVGWVLKEPGEGRKKGRRGGREERAVRKIEDGVDVPAVKGKTDGQRVGRGKKDAGDQVDHHKIGKEKTFQRYYHLYRKGELESDIIEAGGEVVESGYEKDNWWAIATPNILE